MSKILVSRDEPEPRPNVDVVLTTTMGMSIAQLDIHFVDGPMHGQVIHVAGSHTMVDNIRTLLQRVLYGVGIDAK